MVFVLRVILVKRGVMEPPYFFKILSLIFLFEILALSHFLILIFRLSPLLYLFLLLSIFIFQFNKGVLVLLLFLIDFLKFLFWGWVVLKEFRKVWYFVEYLSLGLSRIMYMRRLITETEVECEGWLTCLCWGVIEMFCVIG